MAAVSPQAAEFSKELSGRWKLGFDLLTDLGNRTASAYGLVYDLPPDLKELYKNFGIDLETYNGAGEWRLPMPARYVIDPRGTVRWAAVNPDYTRRPEPEETLAALDGI